MEKLINYLICQKQIFQEEKNINWNCKQAKELQTYSTQNTSNKIRVHKTYEIPEKLTVKMFGSKMMSLGLNPTLLTRMSNDLWQISTFRSASVAWPCSSKAMTTTAAPYLLTMEAFSTKSFSPSFKEIELTMLLPWQHLRPASTTLKSEES